MSEPAPNPDPAPIAAALDDTRARLDSIRLALARLLAWIRDARAEHDAIERDFQACVDNFMVLEAELRDDSRGPAPTEGEIRPS